MATTVRRLDSIQALRGLAALSVAWFHLTDGYPAGPVRASGSLGWLGVDCFFVISGFVIPYSLYTTEYGLANFRSFMARRLVRLEPPFIVSVILVIALNLISTTVPGFQGQTEQYGILQILSHLFYLIPLTKYQWVQPVYWSPAYEFLFYIVVGLTFSLLKNRNIIFILLISAAVILLKFLAMGQWDARILLFVIGISAVRRYVGRDGVGTFLTCLLICAIGMAVMGAALNAAVGVATALVIVFVSFPALRVLSFLGAISYSLYLTHVPIGGRVVNLGRRFGVGPAYDFALSLTALAVAIVFAWVFWRVVEATATRWPRRVGARRRSVSVASGA